MPSRVTLWPLFARWYFSRPTTCSTTDRMVRLDEHVPSKEGISKTITFKEALLLAGKCQHTLDGIERLRGVTIPASKVQLQVDRNTNDRRRRVFRLYGPAREIHDLTSSVLSCGEAWHPVEIAA